MFCHKQLSPYKCVFGFGRSLGGTGLGRAMSEVEVASQGRARARGASGSVLGQLRRCEPWAPWSSGDCLGRLIFGQAPAVRRDSGCVPPGSVDGAAISAPTEKQRHHRRPLR